MKFLYKNKKITVFFISLIIISLISLLIISNFVNKKDNNKNKYIVIEASDTSDIEWDDTNEGITGENIKVDSKGNRVNSISELTKEHEEEGFIISDLYLSSSVYTPDYCVVAFDIINNSNIETNFNLAFTFYDKNGNALNTEIISFPSMEKGKKIKHTYQTYNPILNASSYSFTYFRYE